jgi:hypothetical protein
MSDETAPPDDERTRAIRDAILAGAAEGAEAAARRIIADTNTGLDEVKTVLQALAAGTTPQAVTAARRWNFIGGFHGTTMIYIGPADVAAAADELSAIRQPDARELFGRHPASRWTKQELVLNSLFLVAVAYWLLPPTEQEHLADLAALVQAVIAVAALLKKP